MAYKKEVIGTDVEVVESKNASLIGLKGKIIDETRNMVTIKTKQGKRKVLKNTSVFLIDRRLVNGLTLVGKSEDRLK